MSSNGENDFARDANTFGSDYYNLVFREAARQYLENDLLANYPEIGDQDIPEPSELHQKKILKMIKQARRRKTASAAFGRVPRIVAVVLIVFAVLSITVMSVEALRVPFLNLFIVTEEEGSDVNFNEDGEIEVEQNELGVFGYIPEGFEIEAEDVQDQATTYIFKNKMDELLVITRSVGETGYSIDTENADFGEVMINDVEGFFAEKDDNVTILFSRDGFVYCLSGPISRDEMIQIAEKMK